MERCRWQAEGIGANTLADEEELPAILISTGTKGRPVQTIARDLLARLGSVAKLANEPLDPHFRFKAPLLNLQCFARMNMHAGFDALRTLRRSVSNG